MVNMYNDRHEGCGENAMDIASEHGYLELVKFLHENRSEGCTWLAMFWASGNRHIEMVKFLRDIGCE